MATDASANKPSWKGSLVKVSVDTSVKFLKPWLFSKYNHLSEFQLAMEMIHQMDRGTNAPEGTIMLCVEDKPLKFLVLHNGATYYSLKKFYEEYHE